MKHLVIGDPHAKPGVSNDRFKWLGKLVVAEMPDVIINMGDWADMESLCSYDKGKRSYEGRRYLTDIDVANDALYRFHGPIREHNLRLSKLKLKQYRPRMIALMGNHEHRITKVGELQAELHGVVSTEDIKFKEYGWEVHPFLSPVEIDGILYNHYFETGVLGKPMGGSRISDKLIHDNMQSSTVGHGHFLHYATYTKRDGRRFHGLEAGCFFEHDEAYAGMSNRDWWRGIIIKDNVKDGDYDLRTIRMETLKATYAKVR